MTAAAAAVLAGAAGVMFAAGRLDRPAQTVREVVYVDRPTATNSKTVKANPSTTSRSADTNFVASSDSSPTASQLLSARSDYLAVRDRALRWGVSAALPTAPTPPGEPRTPPSKSRLNVEQLLDDITDVRPQSKTSTNHGEQL
jgi:hypothetical protein